MRNGNYKKRSGMYFLYDYKRRKVTGWLPEAGGIVFPRVSATSCRGMGNLASETIWFTCRLPLQLLTARGNSAATAAVGQQSAVIR